MLAQIARFAAIAAVAWLAVAKSGPLSESLFATGHSAFCVSQRTANDGTRLGPFALDALTYYAVFIAGSASAKGSVCFAFSDGQRSRALQMDSHTLRRDSPFHAVIFSDRSDPRAELAFESPKTEISIHRLSVTPFSKRYYFWRAVVRALQTAVYASLATAFVLNARAQFALGRQPAAPISGRVFSPSLSRTRFVAALYILSQVGFIGLVCHFCIQQHTDLTYLIEFGAQYEPQRLPSLQNAPHFVHANVNDRAGYDGQFYAQLALTPTLRDPGLATALDGPAYRARRMLFSWSAWLLGFGRPAWVLQAYAAQNVLCWLALAWLLTLWIPPVSLRNYAAWGGCLFCIGLMYSVRKALTDLPATLLIAGALAVRERAGTTWAAAAAGFSALGRETNVLAGFAMLDFRRNRGVRSWARLGGQLGLLVLPLAVWMPYVWSVFGHGDGATSGNFAWPLTGMIHSAGDAWTETLDRGWHSFARFHLLAMISLAVQPAYLAFRAARDWRNPWWRVGAVYALLLLCLGPQVWEEYISACRATVPMTLAFNILLVREKHFWPLAILGNLTVLHGIEFFHPPLLEPYLQ